MAKLGFVLVHGYTGNPNDLTPLANALCSRFGDAAVCTVFLPGHGDGQRPAFDAGLYEKTISDAVNAHLAHGRKPVLLGHSTGGCLAIGYLLNGGACPAMLILAGTPAEINGRDLERWEHHRRHKSAVALGDVARMVSYINRVGRSYYYSKEPFPVLVLTGGSDALVTPENTETWSSARFRGPVRSITIPGATHELFLGPARRSTVDCVVRTLSDLALGSKPAELKSATLISDIDTGVSNFIASGSSRTSHLVRSPAALRALGKPVEYTPIVNTDPVQINIEITSRCNLACGHCARSFHNRSSNDMELEAFEFLLDLMPNSYKIVLVGLGEPTLHPLVAEFVALASQRGHSVGLVTNAMSMEKEMSRKLIAAGLQALTFSLDSMDPELASQARCGTDLDRITYNIQNFMRLAHSRISTAVFTAVSSQTVHHLPDLANAIAGFGVNAWMLSDMNFQANRGITLWKNWNPGYRVSIGSAVKFAFMHNLPVLSVRGLEELGLGLRYHDYLITAPAELSKRSATHQYCLSPWQSLPVDVDGNVTICDCQPDKIIGNLYENGFSKIWNGAAMQAQRRSMRSEAPLKECRICPRF